VTELAPELRQIIVDLPLPVLKACRRRFPGWTWSEIVGNGLMLALAWDEHPPESNERHDDAEF
jgi:hypothetical protein